MTLKTDPDYLYPARRGTAAPMRLRIAIPAFGFLGRNAHQAEPAPNRLSREEIASLFQGELRNGKPRKLTDLELREQDLQDSIRRALYPASQRSA